MTIRPPHRSCRAQSRHASWRSRRTALALACLALAACGGGDNEGGLSSGETERLDNASEMLEQRDVQFEDREVDDVSADEQAAAENGEAGESESAQD